MHDDRMDNPLMIPESSEDNRKTLERLLDTMIEMWFDKDDLDPGNPGMWTATEELRSKYKELNGKSSETETEVNKKITATISKKSKANLQRSANEEKLIKLFELMNGGKRPPKRVASSQLDEERMKLADRKEKWTAIMTMLSNAKPMHDACLLSGEDGEPRDIIEDEDLE